MMRHMVRRAAALLLGENDEVELARLARASSVRAGLAMRARIVLLAADGTPNVEIAELVGVSRPTVNLWRNRYTESGVRGLQDDPKPGRPRTVDRNTILTTTLTPPPKRLGVTHWSSRLLADELKVAQNTVLRTWRHYRGAAVAVGDVKVLDR